MDLKSTYNKIAKDWSLDHKTDTWWIEGTDKYISLLPKGASILDIGCGSGEKSKYLTEKRFHVTGIDFSEEMIKIAKELEPKANFFVQDIMNTINLNQKFDGVFAQAVLLHVPKKNVAAVLENFICLLKPGGYLYIAVKERKNGNPEEEIKKESDYGYEYERFFSYFETGELKRLFLNMNLKILYETVTKSGNTNWIQIIGKLK